MIRNAAMSMLHNGITTFVDFREGGLEGIFLLQEAVESVPIKKIILGRIDFSANYKDTKTVKRFPQNGKDDWSKSKTKGILA